MDYQSLLCTTLMSEPPNHALVPTSERQILPASQSNGALAGMVADALAIVATQAPSLSRVRLALLIADDDGPLLDYLVELLTPSFHVVAVRNCADALEVLTGTHFDVIISGNPLPRTDANWLYSRAAETRPELCKRFIFLRASDGIDEALTSIDGAHAIVLRKPVRLDQWDHAILSILKRTHPARFRSAESVFTCE